MQTHVLTAQAPNTAITQIFKKKGLDLYQANLKSPIFEYSLKYILQNQSNLVEAQ